MTHRFSGETFDPAQDGDRLSAQYDRVYALMCDEQWRTLDQIAVHVGAPTHSVSARLRDMRKARFGSHEVSKVRVSKGLYKYRLITNLL
jgi:hypothetical protein